MGAIFGIVGEALPGELEQMAAAMPHRGTHFSITSPDRNVYLGQLEHSPIERAHNVDSAVDWQLDIGDARVSSIVDVATNEYHRLITEISNDPVDGLDHAFRSHQCE